MKIHSEALYSNLLQDLTEQFPNTDFKLGVEEWPGMTPQERQATALQTSLLKKFKDVKGEDADSRALEKFLLANSSCRDWELRMENSGDELLIGQFRNELYRFFTHQGYSIVSGLNQLGELGRTGPGASIGARGKDFYTKLFSSPLACTSEGIWTCYRHYVANTPLWSRAEAQRELEYGVARIVAGNRLSFVDKNADISRVICTEPGLNMFLQLGLGAVFEQRLRRFFGIDVRIQQNVNRELARLGSAENSLCTIDLSSASDTVSRKMIQEFLPKDIVQWLEFLRSPTCTLPNGDVEPLHMISSMGNGFTFPLETIVFACAVSAVYAIEGIPLRRTTCSWDLSLKQMVHRLRLRRRYGHELPDDPCQVKWEHGNFGVFGDDIIAEKETATKVVRLLNMLGFQVNSEKSFLEGPFRESCGADYFDGLPVRGVYIKSLKTQQSRYVAINRLNEWSALTGIRLRRTVRYLMKGVRRIYVPLHENDDAGIKLPSRVVTTLGCTTDGQYAGTKGPIYGTVKYKAYTADQTAMRVDEANRKIRGSGKRRIYNDDALFLAYLRGDIVDGRWVVRKHDPRYRTKWKTSLYWDRVPTVGKTFPIGTMALAKATEANVL